MKRRVLLEHRTTTKRYEAVTRIGNVIVVRDIDSKSMLVPLDYIEAKELKGVIA